MMITWAVSAQTLTANAPSQVQNGENFRLTYTVNTSNASDFRIGEIPEALEIITGPYTSEQSNFQMVNGHTSSSSSITYTYILCANKNGSFTIPAARVHANGKTITSNPLKVTVSGKAAGCVHGINIRIQQLNHAVLDFAHGIWVKVEHRIFADFGHRRRTACSNWHAITH